MDVASGLTEELLAGLAGISVIINVSYQEYQGCTRENFVNFANDMDLVILITGVCIIATVVCLILPCLIRMLVLTPYRAASQVGC